MTETFWYLISKLGDGPEVTSADCGSKAEAEAAADSLRALGYTVRIVSEEI